MKTIRRKDLDDEWQDILKDDTTHRFLGTKGSAQVPSRFWHYKARTPEEFVNLPKAERDTFNWVMLIDENDICFGHGGRDTIQSLCGHGSYHRKRIKDKNEVTCPACLVTIHGGTV